MPGINPVGTWTDPNFEVEFGTEYKTHLDNAIRVGKRFTDAFAPHAAATPAMSVVIDAGFIFNNLTLVEQAQQTITAIPAPATNPRIDRIVIDQLTGVASRIAGAEGVSPSAPALTADKAPCARIALTVGQVTITNAAITDERVPIGVGRAPVEATFAITNMGGGNISNKFFSAFLVSNTTTQIIVRVVVKSVDNSGAKGSGNITGWAYQDFTVTHSLSRVQIVGAPTIIPTDEGSTGADGTLQVNYM